MKQEIFQSEFVNFSGELTSFIYRLVANKQDAEDLAQDTYIKAVVQPYLLSIRKSKSENMGLYNCH